MASFYDTASDADLNWVEDLLKKKGIAYTLRGIGAAAALKEILVAEEDFADAERILCSSVRGNN